MIVLVARLYVTPGSAEAVSAALRKMTTCVRKREPRCLLYFAHRSTTNPDLFLMYEQYADDVALQEHRETVHFKEIIEGIVLPHVRRRERETFEPLATS